MGSGLAGMKWDDALDYCQRMGLDAIELPVGGYPGKPFFDPRAVLKSKTEQTRIKDDVKRRGLVISALAAHGNPVHPAPSVSKSHARDHDVAVRLAKLLGTSLVINFSGCPGGAKGDVTPNWATCAWPTDYPQILRYQWEDVLVPFWSARNAAAKNEGVKIAFEAHPGFCVYNPETILKLRKAAGKQLGANLDPSHFFWQGIDPVEAARVLGDGQALFYVHAKDTAIDPHNTRINGVLDTKSYGDLASRSWVFRTCGYGNGDQFWKRFFSMLRAKGYDGVISIEHEDSYMSVQEGFEKAVSYLSDLIIRQKNSSAWWF
jgi:sugar phosphate isomerase/epimerase